METAKRHKVPMYHSVAMALWRGIRAEPRLKRLGASIAFIEQPVKRQHALTADLSELSEDKPVIIIKNR